MKPLKKIILLSMLLLSQILSLSEAADSPRPNILFITLDATRQDHLGCYGYGRDTSPRCDQIAREGVQFTNVTSLIPLTVPSHASIMTGLRPDTHLVFCNTETAGENLNFMAETMRDLGYATAGFVSTHLLNAKHGFNQGFDYFADNEFPKHIGAANLKIPANETVDRVTNWLSNNHNKRFFIWVHLFDPHYPYLPPDEYGLKYNTNFPKYKKGFMLTGAADAIDPDSHTLLSPQLIEDYRNAYDSEIAFADDQLTRIFDLLKEKGLYNDTVIVIASDHGEILYEKKHYFGHYRYLYNGSTEAILIMKIPGIQPKKIDKQMTLADILPTLAEYLGITDMLTKIDGISYWPLISGTGNTQTIDHDILLTSYGLPLPKTMTGKSDTAANPGSEIKTPKEIKFVKAFNMAAVLKNNWKLIARTTGPRRYELYDLAADPSEEKNLANAESAKDVFTDMKSILVSYLKSKKDVKITIKTRFPTEEMLKDLKSLGYAQ